jgi:hypothetical protein
VVKSRCTGSFEHGFTTTVLIVALAAILLLFPATSSRSVYATHLGTSSQVWGINAATISDIHQFDPITDTTTTIPRVPTSNSENGRGIASDGTNIWYTILNATGFRGDGKIHKIAPTGGPDIAVIPDPFGPNGRGIGALDFDGRDLWALSYLQSDNNTQTVFKIDSNTGTVLASCEVPAGGGGVGADTLAIVSGKILTDAGELLTNLTEYNPPSGIGGACARTGNVFTLPVPVTGIDTDSAGNLLVTDLQTLYNLGPAPYSIILASQPNAFGQAIFEEDITTQPELNVQTSICPEENVHHWDKILFVITDPRVAQKVNVTSNTELDIKVQDDPHKVADIKQKVIDFLKLPSSDKRAIKILNVNYAIICALQPPPSTQTLSAVQSQSNVTSSSAAAMAKIEPESLSKAGIEPQDENMTTALPPPK